MKQSSKFKLKNAKLMNLFILNLAFCILIFQPLISEAAYKIYLKNGQVMTGVDWVKEEDRTIKIYKNGIMLEMQKANILKIEEYETDLTKKEIVEEKTPIENQLPEYLRYERRFSEEVSEPGVSKRPEEDEEDTEEETEGTKKPRASERQLKRLEKLEKTGELPESAKPYKEFLNKLHKQKKLAP